MANPGRELAALDFEAMLGGPLSAVVDAQAQSAMTTVNFVRSVGFEQGTDTPIYVSFKYPKEVSSYQPAVEEQRDEEGNVTTPAREAQAAVWQEMTLTVPILTMLPIPFIRVEEAKIDFNAKINSVETREHDRNLNIGSSWEAKAGFWGKSVKLKASMSYQSKTRIGNEIKRTYSLAVHIRAVQDEMPEGMERLLGILENAIVSQPSDAPSPSTSKDS